MIDFSKNISNYSLDEIQELFNIIRMKAENMGIDVDNPPDSTEIPALTWEDVDNYYEKAAKLTLPRRFGMIRPQKDIKTMSDISIDKSLEETEKQEIGEETVPQQTPDKNAISIFDDDGDE